MDLRLDAFEWAEPAHTANDSPRAERATGVSPPPVELTGVDMAFDPAMPVLRDINLTLAPGEFVAIVGPSGCGKSTLLRLISGLNRPTAGSVRVEGQIMTDTPPGIGFMFQRDALLPWASVRANIALALEARGIPRFRWRDRVDGLLRLLGLEAFGDYYPAALSGGMRQRVALGRLLAYEPDIYLMDEPFGALDAQTKVAMGRELLRLWSLRRKTVVFVTHDIDEAVTLADRVIVIAGRPGRIVAEYRVGIERPREPRAVRRRADFHAIVENIWQHIQPVA